MSIVDSGASELEPAGKHVLPGLFVHHDTITDSINVAESRLVPLSKAILVNHKPVGAREQSFLINFYTPCIIETTILKSHSKRKRLVRSLNNLGFQQIHKLPSKLIIWRVRQCRFSILHISSGLQMKPHASIYELDRRGANYFQSEHKEWNSVFGLIKVVRTVSLVHQYPRTLAGLLQVDLPLDGPQGSDRSTYSAPANPYKQASENSGGSCEGERPSLNKRCVLFVLLCFGGLFFAFGPGVSFDNKWGRLCAYCGIGSCCGGLLFWFLSNTFPYSWGLPPQWLPARWNPCEQGDTDKHSHSETVSQKLLTSCHLLYYTNYMANVLSTDKQIGIIGALCEGSSIRSIERQTGVHRDTIMRLGVKVGKGCTALMDAKMRNLDCHRLEMDEIWGYVGKKEKHVRPGDDPQFGNVWTFCAIDADTKLVPTFRVSGDRDVTAATAFALDVADRMKNRVQISTDGLGAYVEAIDWAFSGNVDYGQIIKVYGTEQSVEAQRRYSAPKITSSEKKAIFGRPDFDLISTSYVERLNGTTRLHMKRLARLTHAFSKKRENFEAAVGLHFAYYNFVRRHNTLRCTPAMAAGVEPSFWSVGQLLEAAA